MKENTKKYIMHLIDWLEMEINTTKANIREMHRTRRKLKRVVERGFKN